MGCGCANFCSSVFFIIFEVLAWACAVVAIVTTYWIEGTPTATPTVTHAGLWRVCYATVDGRMDSKPVTAFAGPAEDDAADYAADLDEAAAAPRRAAAAPARSSESADDTIATLKEPAGGVKGGGAADGNQTTTEEIAETAKEYAGKIGDDFKNFFTLSSSEEGACEKDVWPFYKKLWGTNYYNFVMTTRALTCAFVGIGIIKALMFLIERCGGSRNGRRGMSGMGKCTFFFGALQVICGWAGWLAFFGIMIQAQRAASDALSPAAGPALADFWGWSFWLFLAATGLVAIGNFFICCW